MFLVSQWGKLPNQEKYWKTITRNVEFLSPKMLNFYREECRKSITKNVEVPT